MREQFEIGYREHKVKVTTTLGEALNAVTFVAENPCDEGQPTPKYLDRIVTGAREHGLPEEYIEKVQAIARQAV